MCMCGFLMQAIFKTGKEKRYGAVNGVFTVHYFLSTFLSLSQSPLLSGYNLQYERDRPYCTGN